MVKISHLKIITQLSRSKVKVKFYQNLTTSGIHHNRFILVIFFVDRHTHRQLLLKAIPATYSTAGMQVIKITLLL